MLHEPKGEDFNEPSSIKTPEARLDVKVRGFWQASQLAFFDTMATERPKDTQIRFSSREVTPI